jgi:hypothetical protein
MENGNEVDDEGEDVGCCLGGEERHWDVVLHNDGGPGENSVRRREGSDGQVL